MPCDTRTLPGQTLTERKTEVLKAVEKLSRALAAGAVKPVLDKRTGAITFAGLTDADRSRCTDACLYRRLMVTGSGLAKAAIAKAEMVAGRKVSLEALAHGHHSHDGGATWHHGH